MIQIVTERLHLVPFTLEVAEHFYSIYGDPDVMKFMGAGAKSRSETDESVARKTRHWREHGYGLFCVYERRSNSVIGHAGLGYLPQVNSIELAYLVDKAFWNQGLATEAARACIVFGFEKLRLSEIISISLRINTASVRIMKKSGLQESAPLSVWGKTFECYRINRPQYDREYKDPEKATIEFI